MWIKSRLLSGTFWTTLATIVSGLTQIATLSILSRYLAKSDFGIVAIVTIIYGLIQTFTNLGFSVAIMHKKDLSDEEFSSLFWIQFVVFFVIYLLSACLTPVISSFYNEEILNSILPIFLLALIFLGIGQLYGTLLLKEMQFRVIAVRNIVSQLVAFAIAIVLAILQFGVYSYVLSLLLQIVIVNVWNFISGYKYIGIKGYISIRKVCPLVRIGLFQTGSLVLDYIASSIDVFIIGKWLGMENLGMYNLAKDLVKKIVAVATTIATKVATPFFAEIQEKKKEMANFYVIMLRLISFINFPICVMIGAFSLLVAYIVYGAHNIEVGPLLTVFALWGMLVSVGNPVSNIIIATGRTDLSFVYTICRIAIVFPLTLLIALRGSLIEVAMCTLVCELIVCILSCKIELTMTIGLSIKKFLSAFAKQFVISLIFIIMIFGLLFIYTHDYYLNLKESLIMAVSVLIIYMIINLLINKKYIKEIRNLIVKI